MPLKNTLAETPQTAIACYHCGEECPDDNITIGEKHFCCQGCKTVFEILNDNGLCRFYDIEQKAGVSLKGRKLEQYTWLDEPEIVNQLIDFTDGRTSKITFYFPQIHCASCIWLLENLYKLSEGVLSCKVNFLKKEGYITYAPQTISLRRLVELLASIGYAPEINLGTLDRETRKPVSKRLIYQLGVAGFGFGNIMLLSFPEYLGLDASEPWFRQLFGYLNILLAIPVAFYSGAGYLSSAWHSLRTRNPGIDLPLALGITVLFARSVYEILAGVGAGYLDSLAGLVFFLLIGKWFQQLTYHRMSFERDYKSYFPIAATKLTPGTGKQESVSVNKLKPGDRILVHHQELIPGDGVLKKGNALIDYSFVSGEAEPVALSPGEKLYAGGRQMGDAIELLLTKKVSQSYLTQLWNDDAFHKEKPAGTSELANKVGRRFTVFVLSVAFLTLIFWLPRDAKIAFQAFTAVLIIACPCAVALNIPFTLGNTVRILSKHGFYLKNTSVVEALRAITAVVFDKTGTLTLASGNALEYSGKVLTGQEQGEIKALASQSMHPLSRLLVHYFEKIKATVEVHDFREEVGLGVCGRVGGNSLKIGSAEFVGVADSAPQGTIYIAIGGEVKGAFQLHNRYRPDTWNLLRWFGKRTRIYLLSGDNEQERPYLEKMLDGVTSSDSLRFNQSPKDKLAFVRGLQSGGERVLMVGDGLNDAGALSQSDAGVVVAGGTNNFTPACDAILDERQFGNLPQFLNFSRAGIRVVYAAWGLAAIYNIIGLSFAVQGKLSPVVAAILMPASSLTIVIFGVGASTLLAKKILKSTQPNY